MRAYQQDSEGVLHEVTIWVGGRGRTLVGQSVLTRTDLSLTGTWRLAYWGGPGWHILKATLRMWRTDLGAEILVDEEQS